jgi:SAM-dependent methyltransferase
MKLRESGMPEEAYWETLFNIKLILDRLGVDQRLRNVVELGCGYGTFTLPVARRITRSIRTFDIDASMVERTARRAVLEGVENVICAQRDVFQDGFGIEAGSQDACLLFNILHCETPPRLFQEAVRVLGPSGLVLVIHWRHDPATPRGPSMEIRPHPEQIIKWAAEAGLTSAPDGVLDLPPWHYGVRFRHRCRPWAAA